MEYTFFEKIAFKLARLGLCSLKNASDKLKDDIKFVTACVKAKGGEEFKYASVRLRGDMDAILSLIKIDPKVLDYKTNKVYDRYRCDGKKIQKKVEVLEFLTLCWCVRNDSVLYFSEEDVKDYLNKIQDMDEMVCEFQGKKMPVNMQIIYKDIMWIEPIIYNRPCL